MSGRGGAEGTESHNEGKRSYNEAANETERLRIVEINGWLQDLISRVEEDSKLNFLRQLALKAQKRESKRQREENEREKRKKFMRRVSHDAPS